MWWFPFFLEFSPRKLGGRFSPFFWGPHIFVKEVETFNHQLSTKWATKSASYKWALFGKKSPQDTKSSQNRQMRDNLSILPVDFMQFCPYTNEIGFGSFSRWWFEALFIFVSLSLSNDPMWQAQIFPMGGSTNHQLRHPPRKIGP